MVGMGDMTEWNNATDARSRAALVTKKYTDVANKALDVRDAKYGIISEAEKGFGSQRRAELFGQQAGKEINRENFEMVVDQLDISDAAKGQLLKAWDDTLGKMTPDELKNLNWTDVGIKITQALEDAGVEAEEALE